MTSFLTKVKSTRLSQPDAVTCQSACLAMAFGYEAESIPRIRQQLLQGGDPGDPSNMADVARSIIGPRYSLDLDASLNDCKQWLTAGEFLITHGWFTGSGHVICLDGCQADAEKLSIKFDVRDPWGEFDARSWRYAGGADRYDGFYSAFLIYAACVAGQSRDDAARIYRRGELDSRHGGMWVHRIKP
jgi:hypothetical protein